MKTPILLLLSAILAVFTASSCKLFQKGGAEEETEFTLNNEIDSMSYALGSSIAGNLKTQGIDSLSSRSFIKGIDDALKEDSLYMTKEESNNYLREYFSSIQEKKSAEALKKEEKFLSENAEREEVIVTESGLQYEVLQEGDGATPSAKDRVKVHYHGTLLNGEVFDSSVDRGPPSEFALNRVIKGWTEGLQLMKEGAKYKFYIPSELAYGDRGSGNIGPNETLIFEVELLEILD